MADATEHEQVAVQEQAPEVEAPAEQQQNVETQEHAPEQVEAPAAEPDYGNQPAEEPAAAQPAPAADQASAAFAAAQAQAAALAAKFSEEGQFKRKFEDTGAEEPDAKRSHGEMFSGQTIVGPTGDTVFTMQAPSDKVGRIIGRAGVTIKELEMKTGCRIQVEHKVEGEHKPVHITGSASGVAECKVLVFSLLENGPGALSGMGMGGGGGGDQGAETSKILECPPGIVGRIIGRGGETIRSLQSGSGANITVDQNFPPDHPRQITIRGRQESVDRASKMVQDLISGDPGSAQSVVQKYGMGQSRVLECGKNIVGRIIGKGGDTIKTLQKQFGVSIQIDQNANPCKVTIAGQQPSVQAAERAVMDIIEDRPHGGGGGMGGGGGFHGGFGGGGGGGGGFGGGGGGFGGGAPPFQAGFGGPGYGMPAFAGGYGGAPAYGAAPAYGGGYGMPQQQQQPVFQPQPAYGGYGGGQGFAGAGDQYGGFQQQAQQPAPQQPAQPAAGSAWSEQRDDQNRPYFYNSITGVSQWERPAEMH